MNKLSEFQINTIIELLKQGKQIPEEFRWLLFEEKQEMEIDKTKTMEIINKLIELVKSARMLSRNEIKVMNSKNNAKIWERNEILVQELISKTGEVFGKYNIAGEKVAKEFQFEIAPYSDILEWGRAYEEHRIPTERFEPIKNSFTKEELNILFSIICSKVPEDLLFMRIHSERALIQVLAGIIPKLKLIILIKKVFGDDLANVILFKRPLWRKAIDNLISLFINEDKKILEVIECELRLRYYRKGKLEI